MNVEQASPITRHESVLRDEVLEALKSDSATSTPYLALDCTLGGGGHAEVLLQSNPKLFLAGIDRDQAAIDRTKNRLKQYAERCIFLQAGFDELESISQQIFEAATQFYQVPVEGCNAVLADLGLSSDQLDDPSRGFSFQASGPLDMRMDQDQKLTAEMVLNEYQPGQLKRAFLKGGLRHGAGALAKAVMEARPLENTLDFRRVCQSALGSFHAAAGRRSDPATVPFQAIRIEVNDEFGSLERMLTQSFDLLVTGGRLAVISFHSQEDRIVAKTMRRWSRPADEPLGLPVALDVAQGQLLTKQAQRPGEEEIKRNARARSARMRVFCRGEVS